MVNNMEVVTKSAQETFALGEKLADNILNQPANWRMICLYGDLGSGKTTLVQGIAHGLGIKQRIISPTFVFIRQYEISPPRSPFGNTFYHIDLYRIEEMEDIRGLGLEEIFADKNNIIIIEWPEKIKDILPRNTEKIFFKYIDENTREIKFKARQEMPIGNICL